jgi:hypothetical protein
LLSGVEISQIGRYPQITPITQITGFLDLLWQVLEARGIGRCPRQTPSK